eukprot:gene8712-biopygen18146
MPFRMRSTTESCRGSPPLSLTVGIRRCGKSPPWVAQVVVEQYIGMACAPLEQQEMQEIMPDTVQEWAAEEISEFATFWGATRVPYTTLMGANGSEYWCFGCQMTTFCGRTTAASPGSCAFALAELAIPMDLGCCGLAGSWEQGAGSWMTGGPEGRGAGGCHQAAIYDPDGVSTDLNIVFWLPNDHLLHPVRRRQPRVLCICLRAALCIDSRFLHWEYLPLQQIGRPGPLAPTGPPFKGYRSLAPVDANLECFRRCRCCSRTCSFPVSWMTYLPTFAARTHHVYK